MRDATRIPRSRLPAPTDLLVGRDRELAALSRVLSSERARLVTLTGPPGIGKTRLAVECAAAYVDLTGRPAVFLDLAPVQDPGLVLTELAQAIGIEPRSGTDLLGQLAAAGSEHQLVVLDNCEHLLAAASDVGRVLAACPRLLMLATSRERLRLSAEQEFLVPPLALPTAPDLADLASLAANASVALLVDRARRTNPGFVLTAANAPMLASACARLEGLPLAIELAAARLKVLTPAELLLRLGSRMELLAGSTRDVPARQRALRDAIAWSYDLLDDSEQALFRRLSVFVGPWTLADAASVGGVATGDVLGSVESLLDKSLVRRLPGDHETAEFVMLESLRAFAAEQLALLGESGEVRAAHAVHFAGLAVQFEASIGLPEERSSWPRWGRHHADLRAALEFCVETGEQARALPLVAALGWYYHTRGAVGQGQALVDRVLALDIAQPGWPRDDRSETAGALSGVLVVAGILALGTGRLRRAQGLLLRALDSSEAHGDDRRAAIACAFLGHVARAGGRWDEAAQWHRRAAESFRRGGNVQGVAWAQHDLGLLARDRGDLRDAEALLRASLRDFRELNYPWAVAWSAWGLGTSLSAQGDLENARPLLAEALGIYLEVDDPRGVAQCLEALAELSSEQAHYVAAARLVGAAASLRARLSAPPPDAEQQRMAAVERTLARSLGPDAAARLIQAGQAMPAQQASELGKAVAQGTAPADSDRPDKAPLTRRERQVAALVSSGRTNRQIGRVLGISEKTAEVHLQHVMTKLNARNRAEVAVWVVSHQLDTPADT